MSLCPEAEMRAARLGQPCPECGQPGACAYDGDGRALIHVTQPEGAET